MKNIIKVVFVSIFLFSSDIVLAQAPTIDYTILSEIVEFSGQEMEISSTITKTGDSLIWTQINNGYSETMSFIVTDSSSSWDQSTSLGLITYDMVSENHQCELTLSGQENDISATLTFMTNNNEEDQYIFDVNAIIYQKNI